MADNQSPIITPADQQPNYLASSVEKKRAVVMYLLIGIIWWLGKTQQSEYESFHLKQAMGRRIIFVLCLLLSALLLFIPLIKYLPLLMIFLMIILLILCIKQASDGKYGRKKESGLAIFAGIGEWLLGLFEIKQVKE